MNHDRAAQLFDEINSCRDHYARGVTRPSYSELETVAMKVVQRWARPLTQVKPWFDAASNLHIRLYGEGPLIAMGSHLDSVPEGGRYDGVAGVVAGMCVFERVLQAHRDLGTELPNLLLIVYRGEESAWFGKCYLGSLALFGQLPDEWLMLKQRGTGVTLKAALGQCPSEAYMPDSFGTGQNLFEHGELPARFFEVHIEQGPVLVDTNQPIGIVSSIRGNHRYLQAVAHGRAGHSGTVPMARRQDAVANFTRFYFELLASRQVQQNQVVITVGQLSTVPEKHAVSIIPAECRFALEFRAHDPEVLEGFDWLVQKRAADRLIELGPVLKTGPVLLDLGIRDELLLIALRHHSSGIPLLPSGAGHDAAVFQQNGIPTGMIFIRNDHGSHNSDEAMEMDDFIHAVDVLEQAVRLPVPPRPPPPPATPEVP